VYCISPGLSIRYSSDADRALLVAKLDSVRRLGVRSFGLLLDDIPERLQHDADVAAFDSIVDAHVALAHHVHVELRAADPDASLIVCPTQYWGYGDESYIAALGRGLDPSIELFWTGRAICSQTLDIDDADRFAAATRRRPTYWDNYPVNDVAMTHELHIGPYRGRDRRLAASARGIIANAMEHAEASKIAFATIADYCWSPETYDPEQSWAVAIRDVAGPDDVEPFALFADNVRSSCLSLADAPLVTAALEEFTFRTIIGERERAVAAVAETADRLRAAADRLLAGDGNPALLAESRPWIESFSLGADALAILATLAAADRLESDGPARLAPILDEYRRRRRRVFGDALEMTLDEICRAADARPVPTAAPTP
jgi:hyaluronoglucosaminidase